MKFSELPEGRNPLGFRDGLHNPHVEGSGVDPLPGYEATVKAGEIIMGYPDENGQTATNPEPEVLRRNGTFVAFRKFHIRVAAFRKYLREQTSSRDEEELIAAAFYFYLPSSFLVLLLYSIIPNRKSVFALAGGPMNNRL
jgi:deferrochelatase/peroxidase EfeB